THSPPHVKQILSIVKHLLKRTGAAAGNIPARRQAAVNAKFCARVTAVTRPLYSYSPVSINFSKRSISFSDTEGGTAFSAFIKSARATGTTASVFIDFKSGSSLARSHTSSISAPE